MALAGVTSLFFLSFTIEDKFLESSHVDKVFHIAMSIFIALFFSAFFKNDWIILFLVMLVGFSWEVWQFYRDFNVSFGTFTMTVFFDSAGDLFADLVGAVFYAWWVHPFFR